MSITGHAVLRKCLRMKGVMRCFPDYLQWIVDHPDEPVSTKTLQRVETRYRSLFPNARQEEEEDEEDDRSDGEDNGSDGEDNGSDGGSDNVDRQPSVIEMCKEIKSTSTGYFPKYIQRILKYPEDPITDKTAARVKKKYSKLIARKEEEEEEEEEEKHSHEEGRPRSGNDQRNRNREYNSRNRDYSDEWRYREPDQEVYHHQEDVRSPTYNFNSESNEWEDDNNIFATPAFQDPVPTLDHRNQLQGESDQHQGRWPPFSLSEDDENDEFEREQGRQGVPTATDSAAAARAAADAAVRASGPFNHGSNEWEYHNNNSVDDFSDEPGSSPVPRWSSGPVSDDGLNGDLPLPGEDIEFDSD